MNKHLVAAFIAASTVFCATSHGAFARNPARLADPSVSRNKPVWAGEVGKASYYGPAFHGRRSASGARFDQMALTAAHPWLPFGTRIKVIMASSSRSVIVTVNDRIHYKRRIVDLSLAAARELGMISHGVARVRLVPV